MNEELRIEKRHSEREKRHSELDSESPIKMVRLGDVCEIIMGTSPEGNSISKNPLNGVEFHQGKIFFGSEYLNKSDFYTTSPVRFAEAGNIVMSVRAPVGDTNITPRKVAIGRGLCTFKTEADFDNFYLFYYLNSQIEYLKSKSTGSTFKAINKDVISNLQIPLPPLETQKQIASRLDLCADTISKHKKLLELHETLIKSQFVKMFGDPVTNPMGWEVKKFKDLCLIITDGEHATPKRTTKGIYLLSARNIHNHQIVLNDVDYIDENEYLRISKRIIPQEGDVLISCSGSVGRVCSVPKNLKFQLVRSVALLRLKPEISSIFMEYLISSDFLQGQIEKSKTQSTQANLFQGKIAELKGYVPPLPLQQNFATFVQQVEKSKQSVQKSLQKAETLYKALMQKYFN